MTVSYFETDRGYEVDGINFIAGAGAPGGSGDPDTVALGSFYLDSTNGDMYVKKTAGTGADKWKRLARAEESGTSLSWREPVLVRDNTLYADITAAETAANVADLVDGETIVSGDRLLFDNLTSGNENVYIVSGGTGAWTFTEDTNLATDGDTVYTQSGTDAGKQFTFNGTDWVQSNQTTLDELGFIRAFIGKTGSGAETPTYSSELHITTGDNLEVAIGKLDAHLGADVTTGKYLTSGDTVGTSLDKLQVGLTNTRFETTSAGVSAVTTIDTVLVDTVRAAFWKVDLHGTAEGDGSKIRTVVISARHDGHNIGATADATDVAFTVYSKLKHGSISNLTITVDLNGSGGSQEMRLRITSSGTTIDVKAIREVINF